MRGACDKSETGFSLLETLVALAILSISAVVIFQSLAAQSALTSRVEAVSLDAGRDSISRAGFSSVVSGLVPSWPEDQEAPFVATGETVSGLTRLPLTRDVPGLTAFKIMLVGEPSELVYETSARQVSLGRLSERGRFSYLGGDNTWYETWPPERTPSIGQFDDTESYRTPPLPLAIRIQTDTRRELDWVARLDWRAPALPRPQDIADD